MKWSPLMFWEDITYVLQLIANLIKKLLGLDKDEEESAEE